jgi:hypothetical protein
VVKRAWEWKYECDESATESILIDVKMNVLQRIEASAWKSDVVHSLSLTGSTIRKIIGNSEKIRTSKIHKEMFSMHFLL